MPSNLYIYRREASAGARELAQELEAIRYRALRVPLAQKVRRGDIVICWGEAVPAIPGVKILNGTPFRTKFQDAVALRAANVATVEVSQTRPADRVVPAAADPALTLWNRLRDVAGELSEVVHETVVPRTAVIRDSLTQLSQAVSEVQTALQSPAPQPRTESTGTWLPRSNNHVGGNDLLTPTTTPDYYSKKEELVKEYRIHSFLGKSIRAGVKDLREGYTLTGTGQRAHPWIRSWDGGWRIKYDGVSSKERHRELAHSAVEALGLQFGAVDIGERADGSLIVLEVNRAPGLEGGTIQSYAKAIEKWIEEGAR